MKAFTMMLVMLTLCAGTATAAAESPEPPRAAIFTEDLGAHDANLIEAVRGAVAEAGYEAVMITATDLADPAALTPEAYDALVLPDASRLPATAAGAVEAYLDAGGDILALNAPLWQARMLHRDGKWMDRDQYERDAAVDAPQTMLYDFAQLPDLNAWHRSFWPEDVEAVYEIVDEGPAPGVSALHVYMDTHRGWDTFGAPELDASPFTGDQTLTVFSAKGGPQTYTLSVEWEERDGSRWIATIPLTQEWRRYVLTPDDFHFWESVAHRQHTRFNPTEARKLTFGLAMSHTGPIDTPKEYWIATVGVEAPNEHNTLLLSDPGIAPKDALFPVYKYFDISEPVALHTRTDQTVLDAAAWPEAAQIRSPHPRPRGGGFDKGRAWRWIPLIEARNADGAWRGTPAALLIQADGPAKGGQWAAFGVADPGWYRDPAVLEAITTLLRRMDLGVYFVDAGAQFYTYFDDQPIQAGARVANLSKAHRSDLSARIRITDADTGELAFERIWPIDLAPGALATVQQSWTPQSWPGGGFQVVAELLAGDAVVDRVVHEAHVWRPDPALPPITRANGALLRDGEPWRAHGVNYMPSSGIGAEDGGYFENWLGRRSYDPEVIQRDLDIVRGLGMNSVAVFCYRDAMEDQNLLDLLRRCEDLGIYVNLSLRHSNFTPKRHFDQLGPAVVEMIRHYRLAEHNIVFAYDLAWEPMWMTQQDRREWDARWEAWVIERYGSIEAAEADWDFPIPRDEDGAVTNPDADQTRLQGPWARMVAAYRRFLDTLVYEFYSQARALVRTVDPNTAVSFRMAEAGNPTMDWQGILPYDFPYLAAAVDLLEPEAYGRIGDWDRVKPGWFEHAYARWAGPDLPMLWAEAGVTAWDIGLGRSSEEKLAFQGEYFADFYRMLIGSGADGIYFWWYPGGFRYGENSDYGIVNPDGTDRPATAAIREHAQAFLEGPPPGEIDLWLEFDRDKHPSGITGVYGDLADAFWEAIDAGHTPGLRTPGTGADSRTCPLVAVGGAPCNGSNPPQYLDGFFDRVEVRDAAGAWVTVGDSGEVAVKTGEPVFARITLTNLAEAAWLNRGEGAVVLEAIGSEAVQTTLPRRVDRHETVTFDARIALDAQPGAETALRLRAVGRTPFGPIHRIRFVPAPR